MDFVLSIDASPNKIDLVLVEIDPTPYSKNVKVEQTISVTPSAEETIASAIKRASIDIKKEWTDTILFLHTSNQPTLNLSMPFTDSKKLSQLVPLEVQDNIPFDSSEFIVSYTHTGLTNGSGNDIHIAMCPNAELTQVLEELKGTSVEPRLISTPTSGLQGIYEYFGSDIENNAAFIIFSDHWVYLGFAVDKKFVSQRAIKRDQFYEQIWGNIQSSICNIENRFNIKIDTVYRIVEATSLTSEDLTPPELFDREIKDIGLSSLFPHLNEKTSLIAILGSVLSKPFPYAPKALANYRVGKLSFSPPLHEVKKGFSKLTPLLGIFLIVSAISLASWIAIRQYKINELRKTLHEVISKNIPSFTSIEGQEAQSLQSLTQSIQDNLKDLGSPLAAPPLLVLAAVSEDIKSVDGISVSRGTVKNGEVKIDGSAPNYRSQNRLEKAFEKRKNLFCKIKFDSSSSSGRDGVRDFQVTITLCQ
jgi:hypothetical protein